MSIFNSWGKSAKTKASSEPGRLSRITECYTIKSNGAVTLDLEKASQSKAFREGIARLKEPRMDAVTKK